MSFTHFNSYSVTVHTDRFYDEYLYVYVNSGYYINFFQDNKVDLFFCVRAVRSRSDIYGIYV